MEDFRPIYRGEELKALRRKHQITQDQLAYALGNASHGMEDRNCKNTASRELVSLWEIDRVKFPSKYLAALRRLQEAPTISFNLGIIPALTPGRKYAIQEVAKLITILEKEKGFKNGDFEIRKSLEYIKRAIKEHKRLSHTNISIGMDGEIEPAEEVTI